MRYGKRVSNVCLDLLHCNVQCTFQIENVFIENEKRRAVGKQHTMFTSRSTMYIEKKKKYDDS